MSGGDVMTMRLYETKTLDQVCIALCADFRRRARTIAERSASRRTIIEYRYLNDRIFFATLSLAGERESAYRYIEEIGGKIGYAKSSFADEISEVTYKKRKMEIKRRILVALHLVDEK
jgi:hypothetical protein